MELSQAYLQQNSLPQVFERGKEAFGQKGNIRQLIKRGDIYEAELKGSSIVPYKTAIDLGGPKVKAICNCPYEQKGYCKHIVAMGLAIIEGTFTESDATSPPELKLSFESIMNIRKLIKAAGGVEEQRVQMRLRFEQEQYVDALKILLGMYESNGGKFRKEWQHVEQEFVETVEQLSLPMSLAKEMITLIFDRWRKYTRSFQKKEEGFNFALKDWGRLLLLLATENVPRQFLHIRLLGFGLTEDFLKK